MDKKTITLETSAWVAKNEEILKEKGSTWVAKTSSSPTAKRARKPYSLLSKKAPKQHAPPARVANDRSCQKSWKCSWKSNEISMRILGVLLGDTK